MILQSSKFWVGSVSLLAETQSNLNNHDLRTDFSLFFSEKARHDTQAP